MASVFLSPSTQHYNLYVDGNSEEYYTNLIADAMIPYLKASGIKYGRNDPDGTVSNSIAMSNSGKYGLHLAIHSNAAPEHLSGKIMGSDVYYYRDSSKGSRAAGIFANNLKLIYPYPEEVTMIPNTTLAELKKTVAQDAAWITGNIRAIAKNLAVSTADFLGVEFMEP